MFKVGFIGLGNVGAKLARTLLRNGIALHVLDVDAKALRPLLAAGAQPGESPAQLMSLCDAVITCLPTPAASALTLEGDDGLLTTVAHGKMWMEMSTTDAEEVQRLGAKVIERGGDALDCPVSGGCHRASSGNISIFAGGSRRAFERVLPLLTIMGRRILHTGALGSASILKVVTNYLATANLVSCCEALVTAKAAGMDLNVAYEAIRISSGTSFVHETEGQVILNGSRDISFTMALVRKDIGLFQSIAERASIPLELNPLLLEIFADGEKRYGGREWSPNIVRRLEEASGLSIRAPGFPAQLSDEEAPQPGHEVIPQGRPEKP